MDIEKLKNLDKNKEIAYLKNALEDALVEADEIFQFNTLIIDESQDISEEFWDFFTELVNAKDAKWVVCYDKNQRITHVNWKPPKYLDTPQLILNTVIRSTKEIAKTYSKLYEDQIEHYGETGLTPELMLLKNGSWDEANAELENILNSLKKESKKLTKICPVCERPFAWRKKWKKNWSKVKYCSQRCQRNRVKK